MDTVPPPPPPAASAVAAPADDKTIALLSYLTFIGFVIALVMHNGKKTRLGAFHLRQALGLMILGVGLWVCTMILIFIPILGWLLILLLMAGAFILWLMGLISAINGQCKPIPVLGVHFQKWFGNAFE